MKKRLLCLWFLLLVSVLMAPSALGVESDAAPEIQITDQSAEASNRSFTASLTGTDQSGYVLVTVFSQPGQLKRFACYDAAASVPVSLQNVAETDIIRAVWVGADYAPISTADASLTRSVSASSQEEFADAVMGMMQDYAVFTEGAVAEGEDEYALARLIVRSGDALPDLQRYHVAQRVSDAEGHTVLQFRRTADARSCADFLKEYISSDGYVEPDRLAVTDPIDGAEDNQSASSLSWGVPVIHADSYAANLTSCGINRTVTVAVVDTGVDSSHTFLKGRTVSGYDFVANDNDPRDEHYHGTHVAGTIVDCTPGLNVKIMPVRVLNASGSGTSLCVGLGIRYAADHSADVINMSLGGPHSAYKDEAVDYAVSKNVVVVAAAGNSGADASNYCPAHIGKCITVAAIDSSLRPASFTNRGNPVDLAAPGVNIKSCVPGGGYKQLSGTSMASPHVAACAAMLRSEFPTLTPSQVESRLVGAVQKPSGWSTRYGAGIVDMKQSVQSGLYAILYTDGELVFQNSSTPAAGRSVRQTYPVSAAKGGSSEYAGWYDQRTQIQKVTFAEKITPASTALWFYDCANLSSVQNISNLDTSNLTSMSQMFSQCTSLTSLNLSSFNTGNVTDMSQMFFGCEKLQTLDLRNWNTGNVTAMRDMFNGCKALGTIHASSTFTVTRVTDGGSMFEGCVSLKGGYGTVYSSAHKDKTYARIDSASTPGYFGPSSVPPVSEKLYAILYTDGTLAFQNSLTPQSGKTAKETYETDSGGYDGGTYVAWYEERMQIRTVAFSAAVYPSSTALWFYGCENLTGFRNMENLHTDNVTDMSQMFSYCSSLASLDLTGFHTGKVTNAATMFFHCSSLTAIRASSSFTTSQISDSRRMFEGCTALRGGNGTAYSSSHVDKTYARIDRSNEPGYFTA